MTDDFENAIINLLSKPVNSKGGSMTKIIVVAHGQFPDGILTSLELIAGQQEDVVAINFTAGKSADQLKEEIQNELSENQDVLILTDLLGGTPFNISSTLSVEHGDKNIKVLSGLNLAMLLEAAFTRIIESNLDSLTDKVIEAAQNGISDFSKCLLENEASFEGGI